MSSELEAFTTMLTRSGKKFERLNIYDGGIEISIQNFDSHYQKRIKTTFGFSKDGALQWTDAELGGLI